MTYARKKEKKSFYYSKYLRKCNFCCIFAQNFRSMTIQEYISAHRERFIEEWGNLIRIPSVSCQAEHKADMQRCAEKWKELLLQAGCQKAEVLPSSGNPFVYAEYQIDCSGKAAEGREGASAPTVLVYAHYDVIYAEVIAGGTTTRYTSAATAWTNALKNKNATIRVLSDYTNTKQMVFNPTNANSTIILDLNGHHWSHGTREISPLLDVNPTQTGCKLIITDNSASGNGYLENKWEKTDGDLRCVFVQKGELVLQGGALKANNTASGQYSNGVYMWGANAHFTMTGGTVYATDGYSPRGVCIGKGYADIAGGTVEANSTAGEAYALLSYDTVTFTSPSMSTT